MASTIPTIAVKRKSDGAVCSINECDFDAALYSKVKGKADPDPDPAPKSDAKPAAKKSTKKDVAPKGD